MFDSNWLFLRNLNCIRVSRNSKNRGNTVGISCSSVHCRLPDWLIRYHLPPCCRFLQLSCSGWFILRLCLISPHNYHLQSHHCFQLLKFPPPLPIFLPLSLPFYFLFCCHFRLFFPFQCRFLSWHYFHHQYQNHHNFGLFFHLWLWLCLHWFRFHLCFH